MNKKKLLYYTISFLTCFVVVFCGALQVFGLEIVTKLNDNYIVLITSLVLCLIWCFLLLSTSIALLFKGDWRESAFLMFAGANPEDELEQQAVNDSIKQTFLLNLLILVSVVILSGFTFTKFEKEVDGNSMSFSYRLMNDYEDIKDSVKTLDELGLDEEALAKAKDIMDKLGNGKTYYLIPKSVISPYGILCFILIQFITFRVFLYFNRKRFLE